MKKLYNVEEMAGGSRWFFNFEEKNSLQETLVVEITKCIDSDSKNTSAKHWYKQGYTKELLTSHWSVQTYVTDSECGSYMKYNPQSKGNYQINFEWMLEATEENKEILLNEVYNRFMGATGETATERKIRKVHEFAKSRNLELVTEIPEGFQLVTGAAVPYYAELICNMKPLRSGERQTKVLLTV